MTIDERARELESADRGYIERRVAELEAALREIEKGAGRFSRDPLTFAQNVIEDMKALATAALSN